MYQYLMILKVRNRYFHQSRFSQIHRYDIFSGPKCIASIEVSVPDDLKVTERYFHR
jgi:hypothetical protein